MKGIISEFNQKEYDISDASDFLDLADAAKERLGLEYRDWHDHVDAYTAYNYANYIQANAVEMGTPYYSDERYASKVMSDKERADYFMRKDLWYKAKDFTLHFPVSYSDAFDKSVPIDANDGFTIVVSDAQFEEWKEKFDREVQEELEVPSYEGALKQRTADALRKERLQKLEACLGDVAEPQQEAEGLSVE